VVHFFERTSLRAMELKGRIKDDLIHAKASTALSPGLVNRETTLLSFVFLRKLEAAL